MTLQFNSGLHLHQMSMIKMHISKPWIWLISLINILSNCHNFNVTNRLLNTFRLKKKLDFYFYLFRSATAILEAQASIFLAELRQRKIQLELESNQKPQLFLWYVRTRPSKVRTTTLVGLYLFSSLILKDPVYFFFCS